MFLIIDVTFNFDNNHWTTPANILTNIQTMRSLIIIDEGPKYHNKMILI